MTGCSLQREPQEESGGGGQRPFLLACEFCKAHLLQHEDISKEIRTTTIVKINCFPIISLLCYYLVLL